VKLEPDPLKANDVSRATVGSGLRTAAPDHARFDSPTFLMQSIKHFMDII
jgi:hypothetical protein